MNTKLFLPLALALPMLAVSCDKAADAADNAKNAVENMDFSSMKPEAVKEKAAEAVSSLKDGFKNLGDMTDVEKIKEKVASLTSSANVLEKIKGAMPNIELPSMDGMGEMVQSLTTKFKDNADIWKHVEPLINKVKGLMG